MCSYNKTQGLSLWSYKAGNSFSVASRRWSYIKLWPDFQKDCIFRCHRALHWWGVHRNLWRIWLWYYFLPWNSYKNQTSTENGITFPDPVNNPNEFPVPIGITVLLMSSITLTFFWTRKTHGTRFQQLLCHSITLMIATLCPISTLNQQLTNLEQTLIRCSHHCEGWTIKGRDCASALHSFDEIT